MATSARSDRRVPLAVMVVGTLNREFGAARGREQYAVQYMTHRKAFLAASWPNGGRRVGIELPTQQPSGPFPPKDARGGYVLGGRVVHDAL